MLKKISCLLIFIIVLLVCNISVFADKGSDTEKPKQLMTITRPGYGYEKTFDKTYMICGIANSDNENITIKLQKMNKDGDFETFEDVDGKSKWVIGTSGIFAKEVKLDMGLNTFKVIAFDKSDPENIIEDTQEIKITLLNINDVKKIKAKILDDIFNFKK